MGNENQTWRASPVISRISSKPLITDDKPYKCEQCDYQTKYKCDLNKHVGAKHKGVKYPCHQCHYQANRADNLQQHIKSKHKGIKYPCQLCEYKASFPSVLTIHMKTKH